MSNAHVQPNGTYHYHAVPNGLLESALNEPGWRFIQLGWASDGFPIYYSRSEAYTTSYVLNQVPGRVVRVGYMTGNTPKIMSILRGLETLMIAMVCS